MEKKLDKKSGPKKELLSEIRLQVNWLEIFWGNTMPLIR